MQEEEINIVIGKNIRVRRSLKGYSQSALADALGITFQQVQKYEKGHNAVSPARLVQLSKVFGCAVGDLFHDALSADDDTPMPISGRKALHLIQNFERIGSKDIQNRVCDLVRALADNGG